MRPARKRQAAGLNPLSSEMEEKSDVLKKKNGALFLGHKVAGETCVLPLEVITTSHDFGDVWGITIQFPSWERYHPPWGSQEHDMLASR